MRGKSLERGRDAEQRIARQLTTWADGAYRFTRRGLGHRGLPDLVAERLDERVPAWPFPISIKSDVRHAPGLHGLCAFNRPTYALAPLRTRFKVDAWPWWQEIPEGQRGVYWLVWRAHGTWWLSADGGNAVWHSGPFPAILRLSGPGLNVPTMTAPLSHLMALDFRMALSAWR